MAWEDALAVLRTVVSDAVGDVDADAPIYYAPPARIPHKGVSVVWQVAGPEVSRRPSDVRRSLYEQVVQVYRWLPSDLRPEQTVMLSGELNDIVAAINDALDGNLQLDGQAVSADPPVWDDAEGVSYGDATSTYVMMSCSIGVEVEKLNAGFGAGRVGGISLSDNTPEDVGAADAGVGTEASRDDHVHGGGAAAATATPEATAVAGAVGTDTGYARGDHVHADRGEPPAAATATPAETAGTGEVGTGTGYARDDHRHADRGAPHPLSGDDPEDVGTAAAGTSTNISRADHVHGGGGGGGGGTPRTLSDDDPADVGTTAPGTNTDVSRADHVHAGIELTSDTPEDVGTAAVGTATDASRADHVHGGGGGGGSPADPSQLGTAVTISTTPAEYPLGEDLDSANDYEFVFLSANGNVSARISGYALLNNIDAVAAAPTTVAESFGIRVPRQNTTSITNTAGSAVRVWRKDAATLWVAAGRNDAGVTVVVNKVPR